MMTRSFFAEPTRTRPPGFKPAYVVLSLLLAVMLFLPACPGRVYQIENSILPDGKYDTEFPNRSCGPELKKISESIKLINSVAYYQSFVFTANTRLTVEKMMDPGFKRLATEKIFYSRSASGTATCFSRDVTRFALMTCAHIVDFPDTIINYHRNENDKITPFILSVAFKERQSNYVADVAGGNDLEVLFRDETIDIAILGKEFPATEHSLVTAYAFPLGNAAELEWGDFVYLFGFPRGYKMVTRGIVSDPNRDKYTSFLVDAPFNRGFSGGIVLAVRDGAPNFELVGIAKSAAADYEYVLAPEERYEQSEYDPKLPYSGEIFVRYKANIQYGVTHITSVEAIRNMLLENEDYFRAKGYDFSAFTKPLEK